MLDYEPTTYLEENVSKSRKLKKAAADTAAAVNDSATTAVEAGQGALEDAIEKASAILHDAQKKVKPIAKEASKRSADFASKRLDAWEPHINSALDKVSPAVDAARDKVSDDLLPKLQQLLHDAAEHPVAQEATRRGEATVQALKGELEPNKPKKKGFFKTLGKIVAFTAIAAGALAAVRHFLTPKDDGWTAHEPSRAYVNNSSFAADGTASTAAQAPTDSEEFETDESGVQVPAEDEVSDPVESTAGENPIVENEEAPTVTDETEASAFGEGSYVGENPPEGYVIKGNERSKKFHVPGGNGYDRTIAEVWFASEEAAEAAGFSKAQR